MITRDERWVSEQFGWMMFEAIQCDYCESRLPDGGMEEGAAFEALQFKGWTKWVGSLIVCPDCRHRMVS